MNNRWDGLNWNSFQYIPLVFSLQNLAQWHTPKTVSFLSTVWKTQPASLQHDSASLIFQTFPPSS